MADDDDQRPVKEYSGKWWIDCIQRSEKDLDKYWRNSADKVVNRYLDVRGESFEDKRKYNIFWANVQILKSALYANPPKPSVTRQHGDAKDDIARTAALILERLLQFGFTLDQSDMHNAFEQAVEDRLIPGMGQVWLRYKATTEQYEVPAPMDPFTGMSMGEPTIGERITKEEVCTDYVPWRDFGWSPARTWEEVWWVYRRTFMKRRKFIDRFGQDKYREVRTAVENHESHKELLPKGFTRGRVEVYEVWCEDTQKVYWCHPNLEQCLDEKDDLLQLDDFFPCPKPLLATHTTNNLAPRPDFVMSQDQYDELDDLNDRISILTKALRVVGVYDADNGELGQLLRGSEFNMIPVSNWAALGENGGLKGAVDWFPVEQIANVLAKLSEQRKAVIEQIYELTSISDIMRGASAPRETAKAQTLKAQYSSVRLQLTQQAVAKFVRQALRIKAEIIQRHFQPQNIIEQSQIMMTDSATFAQQAVQLLKNTKQAEYRLEISEESLSMADYNAEREMRIELATAIGQFLSQSAQMVQSMPAALPYMLRIIQWVVSAFRGSADIESVLDEAIKSSQAAPPTPPGEEKKEPPPDPRAEAQAKAEADIVVGRAEHRNKIEQIKAEGIKELLTQPDKGPTQ